MGEGGVVVRRVATAIGTPRVVVDNDIAYAYAV